MASLVAQMVKNLPAAQETQVQLLGWEDPLEKEMATHSSIPAWKISWTEEPDGLQSMGSQRVRHNWECKHASRDKLHCLQIFIITIDIFKKLVYSQGNFRESAWHFLCTLLEGNTETVGISCLVSYPIPEFRDPARIQGDSHLATPENRHMDIL